VPALIVTSGPQQGERAEVIAQLTIGREKQDLLLADPEVSRNHAVVRAVGSELEIEDVGSSNGTWVNGQRIGSPTKLADGDEIVVGQTYLRAEIERSRGTVVAAPSPGQTAAGPGVAPPVQAPSAGGQEAYPAMQGDPTHTAPMQTFSYEPEASAPIEGPRRPAGRLIGIIAAILVVLAVIGGVVFFLLNRGPSKEDFIADADAICAAKSDEADAIEVPTDLTGYGPYFEQITQIQREEINEINALEAPEDDAETLEGFMDTQEELAGIFVRMADSANASDQDAFDIALADATSVQSRASDLAQDYGFQNCGKSTPGE
jgi:pSer/pThr/pTyr-binding forkhead associated (FHA) protein